MGWQRMESESERQRQTMRGFFPFTEGASLTGTLVTSKIKDDGKGFFIIKAAEPCTVNVKDEGSKTGQAEAQAGELVGVRKVGANKKLAELEAGTMVRITYVGQKPHEGFNRQTGKKEVTQQHVITIDVWQGEQEAV